MRSSNHTSEAQSLLALSAAVSRLYFDFLRCRCVFTRGSLEKLLMSSPNIIYQSGDLHKHRSYKCRTKSVSDFYACRDRLVAAAF